VRPGTISVRFDGSYQDKLYTTSENTSWSIVPAYFIGNARLGFKTTNDNWEASLEIKNLFNKFYWESVSDASASVGVVTGVPGMPRTWMVTVKRNF
jgi:iron complex outermembrane receptor protein